MQRALAVRLRGEMPQATLDQLRDRLWLRSEGRLGDTMDVVLGSRHLNEVPGHRVDLTLHRRSDPEWDFWLTYQGEMPKTELIDKLQTDIVAAAEELGFTVTDVHRP